jgi:hypothetical protein
MQKESVVARVIQSAALPAVSFSASMESRVPPVCPRSPEEDPADTSSTPRVTLRCPVTGQKIPSLKRIEEEIDRSLTLLNWRWPRSIAVKGIAIVLQRWAVDVGLEKAARRGAVLLEGPNPLLHRDETPRFDPSERFIPEEFADHLEVMIDELEKRCPDNPDSRSAQRLLPSHGSTHPVNRSGDSSSGRRSGS